MAPLISLPIDLTRTAAALESIAGHLSRIGDALERISPMPLESYSSPQQATLSDLRRTDAQSIARIKDELAVYAGNNGVVLDSEAFVQSIMSYEKEVAEAYGAEAIYELPWNKAAGGPIFEDRRRNTDQSGQSEQPGQQPGQRRTESGKGASA